MVVLWITLLFLQQAYSLMPAKIVQLGESATLTCALPEQLSSRAVYWYKQSIGETLNLIAALYKTTAPEYGPEFSKSRFNVNIDENFSSLSILKTVQEDEGIYHCGITEWINAEWSGTYLFVKGNTQRASIYTVVQQPVESKLVHPGDTETLHCSVFSDSENETCPGDHNVFWFRAGSHKSHPNILYTHKNGHRECENRSESLRRCLYHFSKNISSSDAGTYYCAVATCGDILFGNGTTLELGRENAISGAQNDKLHQATEADEELNYAALNFSERKTRARRKQEFAEDGIYSQVTG
ncbi:signal-regulatory protein beta-2-like [Archocentrus centrarchus]|uniref:signal-regulatory protein beta-2-like n=1 Tax=Archocentrus centrarchus TaxID=63155 RepID=UPI0011E9EC54|nr:signal-regulatory protein beta-2-like [Archocentrus centrarchus]